MATALSKADTDRIEAAIGAAEAKTSAEFLVGVVPHSSLYGEWRALGAALITFTATLAAYLFLHRLPLTYVILFQPLVALLAWLLCGSPRLLLPLAPDEREEEAVRLRAKAMFFDAAMGHSSRRTGVLIFLSLLEHRVQILLDASLANLVSDSQLQAYAGTISQEARQGRLADGVCQVLEGLSQQLAPALPPIPGQRSELPDTVRQEA